MVIQNIRPIKKSFAIFSLIEIFKQHVCQHIKRRGVYRVRRVFFFLVNLVEHQKRTQTATIQLGSLEKRKRVVPGTCRAALYGK